jgi:hypothetical protein
MLGARYINYIPVAIDAGLMPLLSKMLAEPNEDCNARRAVMRSLRLITAKAIGARTVLDNKALHTTVLDACVKSAHQWYSQNEPSCAVLAAVPDVNLSKDAKAALRAATDAMHIAANLWTTGTSLLIIKSL